MKNRLFHQLPDSPIRQYRRMLSDLNDELRRAGLPPVKGGRSTRSVQNAILEASKKAEEIREKKEEERARKEEEKRRKAFEKYKEQIKEAIAEAKDMTETRDKIRKIMAVLSPEDQDDLRIYDSDDIVGIAEVYAKSDDMYSDIHDAEEEYQRQRKQAFEEEKEEEEESGERSPFEGVPFA